VELIGKLDRALAKAEEIALALLLVSMVGLAATQVLLRNVWNTAIDWADISLQNLTVVVGLLGAAIATSEGRHLNIDVFSRVLTGRKRDALHVLIGLFAVFVCWQLAQGGWSTYRSSYEGWAANLPQGWTAGRLLWQEVGEGSFPQWLSQLPLCFGFALIGFHFLLRLVRDVASLASGQAWDTMAGAGTEGDAALDELEQLAADAGGDDDRR
jgi:TRAP-type C4-dicarboxylate transport system permease small subunit